MAHVTARAERAIDAPAQRVRTALADYDTTRTQILTEHFSDYRVEAGGQGAGSRVHWTLRATEKRVRDCLVDVHTPEDRLVERDRNSSMVTTWTVTPDGPFRSIVSVETTWNGASGIGGFFERTFAPKGLRRIYDGMLSNLDDVVRTGDDDTVRTGD